MRKIIIVSFVFLTSFALAQKINYVDTELILESMPNYKQAYANLDSQIKEWEKELTAKKDSLSNFEQKIQAEKVLYTENQLIEKEAELAQKRAALIEVKQKYFGPTGDLLRMRQALARPFQDQIWNAINKIAKQKAIGIVLDKSSDLTILYSDPKLDITDLVIKELKGDPKKENDKSNTNSKTRKR